MSDIAIRVENLSKRYMIATGGYRHDSLRDHLMDGLRSLMSRNGHLSSVGERPLAISSQLSAKADTFWALKDVSFEVKQGEVIGIIGLNGAGKSTLLKILSRITEPTKGKAEIHGRVGSLLEVGTGFDRELTGRENIYLSGAILGMRKAEIDRKFDEIVEFSGVERFIDSPVKRYSSGMYVRLAFSVAAHLDPEVLIVDEVLAVGDAAFQKKCLGKMGNAARQGRTVLFVSHNMAVIENLCSRALVLQRGILTGDGPPRSVITSYLAGISERTKTSLVERRDRTGAGDLRITSVELLNSDAQPIEFPTSAQTVMFRLHYDIRNGVILRNCVLSLSVDKDERPYFLLSTDLVDKRQIDLQGAGYLEFIVPDLPLSAGEYYLHTYVESNGFLQDWVLVAASFSVIDGDYYGTGKNYPPAWRGRCVLVKHEWKLSSAPVIAG